MKYTLFITQNCNLSCTYCYIRKRDISINIETAKKAIDFIYNTTPAGIKIEIGFFGGEPLLEFDLIKKITSMIESHPKYDERQVEVNIVTNGTTFTDEIANFIVKHNIGFGISCDGSPEIQNKSRKYKNGNLSSPDVELTIKEVYDLLPYVMVNAVYTPLTLISLPKTIDYFYNLGIRRIFLNPDFSAKWSEENIKQIKPIFIAISEKYLNYYKKNDPAYISLIDGKIAVILNDGYKEHEKCHMGKKEFAITPEGNIYPCERLVGDGIANDHCIGNIYTGINYNKLTCSKFGRKKINIECINCSLNNYCMNWCGCSNYFATGYYNQVNNFICTTEKSSIEVAFNTFQELEKTYGASTIMKLLGNKC